MSSKADTKATIEITQRWVAIAAGMFALLSGVYGAVQAYSLLPLKIQMATREVEALKSKLEVDHERLVRIESNIEWIKAVLDKNRITAREAVLTHQP